MKNLLILIIVFIGTLLFGQNQIKKVSNFVGFYPSNSTQTNGLNIKYWDSDNVDIPSYKTNGLRLGINPIGFFTPFITIFHSPEALSNDISSVENNKFEGNNLDTVNGVDLSLISLESTKINGVEINLSMAVSSVNGISISTINFHENMNGLEVGLIGNSSTNCRGIQVGVVNNCRNLKGIQIGLWNINQTKKLPLINWAF